MALRGVSHSVVKVFTTFQNNQLSLPKRRKKPLPQGVKHPKNDSYLLQSFSHCYYYNKHLLLVRGLNKNTNDKNDED
jgi:hypothetical protein